METKNVKPRIKRVKNIKAGKLLLKFMEDTICWEAWHIAGLCIFAENLNLWDHIDDNQYLQMKRFIRHNKPKSCYNSRYWFQPGNKQVRIDYLKKILYDNQRTN